MQTTSGFTTNDNINLSKEESKTPIGSEVFGLSIKRAEEIKNLVERALNGDLEELNGRDETEGSVHKVINYMAAQATTVNEIGYFMYTVGFGVHGAISQFPVGGGGDPLSELMSMLGSMQGPASLGDSKN